MRSPRAAMAVLLAVLVAACDKSALVPGPGAGAKPRPSAAPKVAGKPASPTPTPAPGTGALASGPQVLRAPARGAVALSGAIALDLAYARGPGAAEFISDQGGGVLGQGGGNVLQARGGQVIANDGGGVAGSVGSGSLGGNVIANNGAGLLSHLGAGLTSKAKFISDQGGGLVSNNGGGFISDQGGGLVSDQGGGLVSNNGGGLVGKTRYALAQADGGPRARAVAGMLVGVMSLADHAYLPLGVDAAGKAVYFVYTDAKGAFTVHIPKELAGNVLVVASVPGTQDTRLAVDLLARPVAASALAVDDTSTVLTTYLRRALVPRFEAVLDPASCQAAVGRKSTSADAISLALSGYRADFEAAGFASLGRAAKERVLVRFADALVARLAIDEVPIYPGITDASKATGLAFPLLGKILARMEQAAAERLAADPAYFEGRPYVAVADLHRGPRAPVAIRKAADLTELVVTEFLSSNDKAVMNRARAVFADLGIELSLYDDMIAAGGSLFAGLIPLVVSPDPAAEAQLKAAIRRAIEDERGGEAGPADPPCPPAPTPPAAAMAVATLAGGAGAGDADGPGLAARFQEPARVAYDPRGFLYVSEPTAHRIRLIDLNDPAHAVTTLVGAAGKGDADGPAAAAKLREPYGLALDAQGTLYVAERAGHRVRRIVGANGPAAVVSTVAGDGSAGLADGAGPAARFRAPEDVGIGPDGTLWVGDTGNNRVRRIAEPGGAAAVTSFGSDERDSEGHLPFNQPRGLVVGPHGLVVADARTNRLVRLSPGGGAATMAGAELAGVADGTLYTAAFHRPTGLAIGPRGELYVADALGHRVRRVDPLGWVVTLAGRGEGGEGAGGYADGPGPTAAFNGPQGVAVGGDGAVYVADTANHRIRVLRPGP